MLVTNSWLSKRTDATWTMVCCIFFLDCLEPSTAGADNFLGRERQLRVTGVKDSDKSRHVEKEMKKVSAEAWVLLFLTFLRAQNSHRLLN